MVGGEDNEMDSFRILNWEWTKVIPWLIFETVDHGTSTKITQNGIYIIFTCIPIKWQAQGLVTANTFVGQF